MIKHTILMLLFFTNIFSADNYSKEPPFTLNNLKKITIKDEELFEPKNDYNIFVNYELGMHCVGFEMSYCCIIPPYNSIQSQVVKSGKNGESPKLLTPNDKVKLHYNIRDNSYSEGNKMRYWSIAKDVDGDGHMDSDGDNVANYVWGHLFIYKDLKGTVPNNAKENDRLRIGHQIKVKVDTGPSGKSLSGGYLDYADENGSSIVMTDTLVPAVKNVKLVLTASYLWDALGLPLTAFNDSRRRGSIRSITQKDFQPFQYSQVVLHDSKGKEIKSKDGKRYEYFGTNPVDIPNCYACHSRDGKAAKVARLEGLTKSDLEYKYWKKYPDESEYMARLSESSINILSLHDFYHGTKFLSDYHPNASLKRLGKIGEVNCADCHGDNISGNLQEPRPFTSGYKVVKAKPLTEAIHGFHLNKIPMPDKANRSQSCQACHPTHFQNSKMNGKTNIFSVTNMYGVGRFSNGDVRKSAGCYVRRDSHSNPNAKPPFFLNAYGKWQLENVAKRDENGKQTKELRGLYCTNCHTKVAQKMYKIDDIKNGKMQIGHTIRNRSIKEIIDAVADGDADKFSSIADPKIIGENQVAAYYNDHNSSILVKNIGKNGKINLKPWNYPKGNGVTYRSVSGGNDWWLSASEPHCADCHIAPFVEQETKGKYFPIDQPNKYSLYRYSKAHGNIACQSCHESAHGLYSTRYNGDTKYVDETTHQQALQYSPDGNYTGPVTCSACHTVNKNGVPTQLKDTKYENNYWAAVTLAHFMKDGDPKLTIKDLVKKYPYNRSSNIVKDGWK